jgi:amidase
VRAYFVTVAAGTAAGIEQSAKWVGREPSHTGFEPATWMLGQIGNTLPAVELQRARDAAHRASRMLAQFHTKYDLLLTATLAYPPVRVGELALSSAERMGLVALRHVPVRAVFERLLHEMGGKNLEPTPNTQLFNQTGQPAMSVPLFQSSAGLPIGVQFSARFGDEATLFRLASQLEQVRPWGLRRPGVSA